MNVKPAATKPVAKTLTGIELEQQITEILLSKRTEANKKLQLTEIIPTTVFSKSPQDYWDLVNTISSRLDLLSDLFESSPKSTQARQSNDLKDIFENKRFAAQLTAVADTLSIDPISLPSALNSFTSSLLLSDTSLDIRGLKSPAISWNILVADSGDGKSRVLSSIQAFLALKQAEEETRYKSAKKAWDGYNDEIKEHNPEPVKQNFYENTATIAALIKRLQHQQSGTLLIGDELIGFFGGLGRYGNKGMGDDDRAQLLSLWGGLPTRVSRIDENSCHTANKPRLSLFGGMQPGIFIGKFIVNDVDGLSARVLPIKMKSVRKKFMGMSRHRESNWECFINDYGNWLIDNRHRFMDLRLDDEWETNPENPTFMRWTNFCYEWEQKTVNCGDLTRAWLSKTRDHLSRIMIPMHVLSCYITERDGGKINDTGIISTQTLEEAIRMFNVHRQFFFDLVKGDIKEKVATKGGSTKEIVKAILALCEEDTENPYTTAREVVRRLGLVKLERVYDRKATELAYDILSVMLGKKMLKMQRVGKQIRYFVNPEYDQPTQPEATQPEATQTEATQTAPISNEAPATPNFSLDSPKSEIQTEVPDVEIPTDTFTFLSNDGTIDF